MVEVTSLKESNEKNERKETLKKIFPYSPSTFTDSEIVSLCKNA
jgi:hypothetical protein